MSGFKPGDVVTATVSYRKQLCRDSRGIGCFADTGRRYSALFAGHGTVVEVSPNLAVCKVRWAGDSMIYGWFDDREVRVVA